METGVRFYKPSGKVPVMGILTTLIFGPLISALMSYLYVMGCNHIPFIYLNLIVWVVMIVITAAAAGAFLNKNKVRNPIVAGILGGIVGLATLYIVWAVYCASLVEGFSSAKFFHFLANPAEMIDYILAISKIGTWSIGHFGSNTHENVTGFFLWIVWVGEAAGIVVTPIVLCYMAAGSLFSESQNRWMLKADKKMLQRESFAGDKENFKTKLLHNDFSSLLELKSASSSLQAHTKIEISSSGSPNENYITVSFARPAPTKKKPDNMAEDKIVENMIVDDLHYNKLKEDLQL